MGHVADLAQRPIDIDEAGSRPAEPPPQQLAQLDRATALRDQREPAKLDLVTRRELERGALHAVLPEPVRAPEVVHRPALTLTREDRVSARDPAGGVVELNRTVGRGAQQPAIRGGDLEDALRRHDAEADDRVVDHPARCGRIGGRAQDSRVHRGDGSRARARQPSGSSATHRSGAGFLVDAVTTERIGPRRSR